VVRRRRRRKGRGHDGGTAARRDRATRAAPAARHGHRPGGGVGGAPGPAARTGLARRARVAFRLLRRALGIPRPARPRTRDPRPRHRGPRPPASGLGGPAPRATVRARRQRGGVGTRADAAPEGVTGSRSADERLPRSHSPGAAGGGATGSPRTPSVCTPGRAKPRSCYTCARISYVRGIPRPASPATWRPYWTSSAEAGYGR
jgi:hypothetical protein